MVLLEKVKLRWMLSRLVRVMDRLVSSVCSR